MPSEKQQIIEVNTLPDKIVRGATYSINQSNPNTYTHGMFKYPCKFIPEVPRWGINSYMNGQGTVFDPFAGSGTTALEAVINGYDAKSTEIDDIAKLITKVKTTKFTIEEYKQLDDIFFNIIDYLNQQYANTTRPELDNLEHWFSEKAIIDLGRIKYKINLIENENIKDFFNVCFVSIIKRVSFADDASPKPYVSTKVKKVPPAVEKEFKNTYKRYKKMSEEVMTVENMGTSYILDGDALSFNTDNSVDLAITSPPYINAFDYGRTMRLENLWMGMLTEKRLREKKKEYIGTEKIKVKDEQKNLEILEYSNLLKEYFTLIGAVDEKRALIVKKFFEDMKANMLQVAEVLVPNGKYMLVIGNSNIRKVNVESWRVIEQLADVTGFETETFFNYEIKNPYIRIPRQGIGGKINKDYIIVLRKKG